MVISRNLSKQANHSGHALAESFVLTLNLQAEIVLAIIQTLVMVSLMNFNIQNQMTHAQLLANMTASYLNALNLGMKLTGNKESAISYANETSCAGWKAKAQAIKLWNA